MHTIISSSLIPLYDLPATTKKSFLDNLLSDGRKYFVGKNCYKIHSIILLHLLKATRWEQKVFIHIEAKMIKKKATFHKTGKER